MYIYKKKSKHVLYKVGIEYLKIKLVLLALHGFINTN